MYTRAEVHQHLTSPSSHSIHIVPSRHDADALAKMIAETPTLRVIELYGQNVCDKDDLLSAMANALECPEYFGWNWDALEECLYDLEWISASGYVIVYTEPTCLLERESETLITFMMIVIAVATAWAKEGIPFHLVLANLEPGAALSLSFDDRLKHHVKVHM